MNSTKAGKKPNISHKLCNFLHLQTGTSNSNSHTKNPKSQNKINMAAAAVMEAFIAKLFASVASLKAAYAELQVAQFPYNGEAIQIADQAVVNELKSISELKRSYLNKQFDMSPHVAMLLAKIQEQQSLIRTYQITLQKMESGAQMKEFKINSLKNELIISLDTNKSIEKTLKSRSVCFSDLNLNYFVEILHYTKKSVKSFVKVLMKEMENANWDLDLASSSIEPSFRFSNSSHRSFAFEAFMWRIMISGFNNKEFGLVNEEKHQNQHFLEEFKRLRWINPSQFLSRNPDSTFAKFVRDKYMKMVHPKMECSLFGNLNQRGLVSAGKCPDSDLFTAFLEMAKRVLLLHCLGFSFEGGVTAFQIRKNCRFSEVYMECVTENVIISPEVGLRVGFMVVPGFQIGKTLIQSQVYPSPFIC